MTFIIHIIEHPIILCFTRKRARDFINIENSYLNISFIFYCQIHFDYIKDEF